VSRWLRSTLPSRWCSWTSCKEVPTLWSLTRSSRRLWELESRMCFLSSFSRTVSSTCLATSRRKPTMTTTATPRTQSKLRTWETTCSIWRDGQLISLLVRLMKTNHSRVTLALKWDWLSPRCPSTQMNLLSSRTSTQRISTETQLLPFVSTASSSNRWKSNSKRRSRSRPSHSTSQSSCQKSLIRRWSKWNPTQTNLSKVLKTHFRSMVTSLPKCSQTSPALTKANSSWSQCKKSSRMARR